MSVSTNKIVIFRMTAADDTESTLTDKIEFGNNPTTPDSRANVSSISITMGRTKTDNPAPYEEQARKPDTGFADLTQTLHCTFYEDSGPAGAIARLRNWDREDNADPALFREGRFGIKNDWRPEFDITPNNVAGYKLAGFNIQQELSLRKMIKGDITLELSGQPSRLGT